MVGHLGGALRSDVGLPSRLGFGDLAAMIKTTLAHHQMVGLMWLVVVLLVGQGSPSTGLCDGGVGVGDCDAPPTGDPYAILGVGRRAEKEAIVKAYRVLARRWHPDKNRERPEVFASIAQAYEVLIDEEKREILDRLGEEGLVRLRDGDPTVKKDYIADDEILRRIHEEGDGASHFVISYTRTLPVLALSRWHLILAHSNHLSTRTFGPPFPPPPPPPPAPLAPPAPSA